MAKRWRSMDQAERADYVSRLDAVTDGMVTLFADETHGPEMWERFVSYAMSLGDVLDARNMVRAFAQHIRCENAKPTDLRSYTEWISVGRTPARKRDVVVFTTFPSHLWDIADTEVTDRKVWRKAPAKVRGTDGASVVWAVLDMVWGAHAVDLSATLPPSVEAPAAPAESAATPAEVQRARLLSEGRRGSLDAMLRAEYDDHAEARYLALEQATNGHMLNDRGRERKVDPHTFVTSGSVKTVTAYASEEAVSYFAANGGVPSFASYKARLMGRRPARQDLVVAG